jgi:hypothetical protein
VISRAPANLEKIPCLKIVEIMKNRDLEVEKQVGEKCEEFQNIAETH